MKKLYCVLLLFVILLTGTSCDNSSNKNGNSSTEINGLPNERQLPKMLIADHNGHYLPQGAKSDFSRVDTSWKNDELTGTVIENLLGKDYTLPYDYNRCFDGFKFDYVFYISNSPFTCAAINSETGQLIYLSCRALSRI